VAESPFGFHPVRLQLPSAKAPKAAGQVLDSGDIISPL
jgi:hypothetical protein